MVDTQAKNCQSFDVIIIGAGAAGLMCALTAGARGRSILLLEHNQNPGEKIRISGGGRCNFTNLNIQPSCFLSENPHFAKSALKQFDQHDFIAMVERHGIKYHEKAHDHEHTLGQLFCDGSSREIIDMLQKECKAAKVDLRCAQTVTSVTHHPENTDAPYLVETEAAIFKAQSLTLATGGRSIPKMGATSFTYEIAEQFGLNIIRPRPGLVPFIVDASALGLEASLAGLSQFATAQFENTSFSENILFTHRGLSGPAILQISSYWRDGEPIYLDLMPDKNMAEYLVELKKTRSKQRPKSALGDIFPQRLAEALVDKHLPSEQMANIPDRDLIKFGKHLNHWRIKPKSSEGWVKAEVTCGGVDTAELSSKTMEAKKMPGLYIIGEAVDVTGWLGGYNFQWAWSSGWCAGQVV